MSRSPLLLTRRKFVYSGIIGISGMTLAGCVNGILGRGDVEITHREIALRNLPPAFEGFTITLASDLHSSPFMTTSDMKRIAKLINDLKSDIIVMPGDFVTSHRDEIPPFAEAMSELKAPYGVLCSTGNHDFYCGADQVTQGAEDAGFRVLRNENFTIERNGQRLQFIGVDDNDSEQFEQFAQGKAAAHIEAALKGIEKPEASILLCHRPYNFEDVAKANIGLMLSGHTHGGQIVLARIGHTPLALSSIASHFVEGSYRPSLSDSKSQLYVSRGLGVVGLPIRINCPPEITKITLRRETAIG